MSRRVGTITLECFDDGHVVTRSGEHVYIDHTPVARYYNDSWPFAVTVGVGKQAADLVYEAITHALVVNKLTS